MNINYGELYTDNLYAIKDTSEGTCIGFKLPIFQVTSISDGQHFIQLFGITKEEPVSKFFLYLNFKFRDFEIGGDNDSKKILDMLYIRRANKEPKFDPGHENFLRFLGNKFGLKGVTRYTMKEDTEFKYIPLRGNLVTFEDFFSNKLELKIYHKEPYYELFLNIDFPNKKVEFREKDEEYRKPIFDSFLNTNSN